MNDARRGTTGTTVRVSRDEGLDVRRTHWRRWREVPQRERELAGRRLGRFDRPLDRRESVLGADPVHARLDRVLVGPGRVGAWEGSLVSRNQVRKGFTDEVVVVLLDERH